MKTTTHQLSRTWIQSVVILLSLVVFMAGYCKGENYAASAIPEALLKDANVVYRVNNLDVMVDGPGSFKVVREIVVTILNEKGKGPDILGMHYDMYSSVKLLTGAIYDARGNRIRKIKKRDLEDTSNFASFSLYEDNRVMYFIPPVSVYPYTVKYVYETSYTRGMFHALSFFPHMGYESGVEKASLQIQYPEDMDIIYHLINQDARPRKSNGERNGQRLIWDYENLHPLTREYLSSGFREVAPGVLFSTDRFQYEQYAGNNHSWQEFGKWIWQLNLGRDALPDERIAFLQELVKDLEDDREKTKAVYEFMQSHTRYVNIALGIGGLQPFDAATTDRTGYGDCKALTNYTMALLKAVGIPSHYTLVYAGAGNYRFVKEDFPINQFNHAILCVPLKNDTVWLECTNNFAPFGHLGDFTDNRSVLLITEEGGKLTKTPAYDRDENIIASSASLELDDNGHGIAHVNYTMGGVHFSDYSYLERLDPDRQKKWLLEQLSLPNYNVKDYAIRNDVNSIPRTLISLQAELRSIASRSDTRLMLPLHIFSRSGYVPPRIRNRQSSFELKFPTIYADTLVVAIPEGYEPESEITDYQLESEFGTYKTSLVIEDNVLTFIRLLETSRGIFAPDQYTDFYTFMQAVNRADKRGIVFVKG